ncbi:60S ribosomal protein L6 [Dionaea muscipula]
MYHRRGLSAIKKQNDGAFPDHEGKPAERKPEEKPPKFYPADDVKKPLKNKRKHKPTRLRFMGKRVVFLKQLPSGLLLVTGPYRINGVPLRRVSQAYVIATSTKVDISGVNVKKFEDKFFSEKSDKKKNEKDANEFFDSEKPVSWSTT